MRVKNLQQAVICLTKEELNEFSRWFEEYMSDQWDAQLERDAQAGCFNAMIERILADHRAGLTTPL